MSGCGEFFVSASDYKLHHAPPTRLQPVSMATGLQRGGSRSLEGRGQISAEYTIVTKKIRNSRLRFNSSSQCGVCFLFIFINHDFSSTHPHHLSLTRLQKETGSRCLETGRQPNVISVSEKRCCDVDNVVVYERLVEFRIGLALTCEDLHDKMLTCLAEKLCVCCSSLDGCCSLSLCCKMRKRDLGQEANKDNNSSCVLIHIIFTEAGSNPVSTIFNALLFSRLYR